MVPLGSDVERPASKRYRDAEPDEDERHRTDQGAGRKGIPGAESPQPERAKPGSGVEPGRFQPDEENGQTQGHRRRGPTQRLHASLSARSIMTPISDRNAPGGASEIVPRVRTITRSARYSTSSRSAE